MCWVLGGGGGCGDGEGEWWGWGKHKYLTSDQGPVVQNLSKLLSNVALKFLS